jgi:DNA-binding response OmpR family regulator
MKPKLALVITGEEDLQNGLLALLTTIPAVSAVLIAETSNSGLRIMQTHSPALVLLDMQVPHDGGTEILIKSRSHWPGIRIIALIEETDQKPTARNLGADLVLYKGFAASKIISAVEDLLKKTGGER